MNLRERDYDYESSTQHTLQLALIIFLIFILALLLMWCYFLINCLRNFSIFSQVREESNSVCRFLFKSAEQTVSKATQIAQPVTNILEKPIKLADSTFCKTVDVVGNTIPKVIEKPQKIYTKAKSVVPVQPAVDCVKTVGSYGKQTVNHLYNKVQNKIPAAGTQAQIIQDENQIETDPEKYDQNGQLVAANGHVKDTAKIFSQ